MGLDVSHGCWSGSYGGFGVWRRAVATTVGINLSDMQGFGGETPWPDTSSKQHRPIFVLLNHSDCDGTGEDQSATQRLEPRLQSLLTDLQRAAQDDWSMQPKYAARYWAEDVERMLDLCTAANKITTNEEEAK